VDVKVPGMVHARNVKPPVAGAKLVSIDESSVRSIPGFLKVVSKGNYVAVVCEREEQAIQAARQLKAEWSKPAAAPFPSSRICSRTCAARRRHRASDRPSSAILPRRSPPQSPSSKPTTTSRFRGTRHSPRPTRWPIRRTGR
jgi:CO/xanthine dehydrogenase Mo-binding subunit